MAFLQHVRTAVMIIMLDVQTMDCGLRNDNGTASHMVFPRASDNYTVLSFIFERAYPDAAHNCPYEQ